MFSALATNNSSLARWLRRRAARHVSTQSPVIIGGSPRSGTTLLRVMLDSHPHIACGPENSLLAGSYLPEQLAFKFDLPIDEIEQMKRQAGDHVLFIEAFFRRYLEIQGKPRWGDKRPHNIHFLPFLFRHFPNARFIHLIRDGRDTVCSLRTHPKHFLVDGKRIPTGIRRPLRACIKMWLRDTEAGLRWRGHPQYLEIHYEKLVREPEANLRRLCEFINEPWHPAMLEYHEQDEPSHDPARFVANPAATQPLHHQAVERWRKDLTADELCLFNQLAGPQMTELGYAMDSAEVMPAANGERAASIALKRGRS